MTTTQFFNGTVNDKPVDGYGQPIEPKKEQTDPNSQNHYGQMGSVEDNRTQPSTNPNYGQRQQMQSTDNWSSQQQKPVRMSSMRQQLQQQHVGHQYTKEERQVFNSGNYATVQMG